MSNLGKRINRLGPNQRKILLLLVGGVGLMLSNTPRQYFRVIKEVNREWNKINRQSLKRAIIVLYKSKLILEKDNPDGSTTMVLSDSGREKVLTYNIESMTIKRPKRWDGKWRVVLFDIPEKKKVARNALRESLRRLGFYEFQKSVFIHSFDCKNEIDYITEFFKLRPYVRLIIANEIDTELHLKQIFHLA